MTGEDAAEGVRDGLESGYRQIDTARAYDNKRDVGRGIAERVSNLSVGLLRQAIEKRPLSATRSSLTRSWISTLA